MEKMSNKKKCECNCMTQIGDELWDEFYTITYKCSECGKLQQDKYHLISSEDVSNE